MSYFNSGQIGHMNSLASIPDERRCWCGWHKRGECPNGCGDHSRAERRQHECPTCGNFPHKPGHPLIHIKFCPEGAQP